MSAAAAVIARAAARPDAVAVVAGAESCTYGELVTRARRLANRLRRDGIRVGDAVVVLLDKRIDVVVAAVAAWLTGAAYLPFDPRTPAERVRAVLGELTGGYALIGATGTGAIDSGAAGAISVVWLDRDPLAAEPAEFAPVAVAPDDIAYLVHTSGSTGVPKLVAVSHRALLANYAGWAEVLDLGGRIGSHLQVAALGFDVHVGDLARALFSGGRLVLCPAETALDPAALHALLHDARIDAVLMTPSIMRLLLDWLERTGSTLRRLRQFALGGEPWTVEEYRRLVAVLSPDARVLNFYGVAEATVDSAYCDLTADPPGPHGIPLGRPFPGVGLRVLAEEGEVGELCLTGPGLAVGYVGRPDLTAERFVTGPDGVRMYRTGDLVRRLPGDVLIYQGRADDQVKVRGVRLHLGEVEAVLAAHPGVRAAAVTLWQRDDETVLIGHVIPIGGAEPEQVREFAERHLAPAMVPSVVLAHAEFPLTATGKVDRSALPTPDAPEGVARQWDSAAMARVAVAWQALLGRAPDSADEDFFAAGGSSLSAARLAIELGVPARRVFGAPTVGGLAAALDNAPSAQVRESALATADQRRLWLLARLRPADAAYHVPTIVDLDGPLRPDLLRTAVETLVARHEALRTVFEPGADGPVRRVLEAGPVELPVVGPDAVTELVTAPFDLAAGPLYRVAVVRLGERRHQLVLVIHHIVVDGWSVRVLLRELGAVYSAFVDGHAVELPVPLRHNETVADPVARAYWRRELADPPAPAGLSNGTSTVVSRAVRHLGSVDARQVRRVAREHRGTVFGVLLAAMTALLHRWSGQSDLVIGAPFGDRDRPETVDVVGLLVRTKALRMAAVAESSFDELVRRARLAVTGAMLHQDVPFDVVVHDLGLSGRGATNPLFRVWLNLLGAPTEPPAMTGLRTAIQRPPLPGALFDLTLYVTEDGDVLDLELVHDIDTVDAAHAVEFLDQFAALLAACCADPGTPIGRHSLRTARAAEVLPDPGADLRSPVPPLMSTLVAVADAQPDRVAVTGPAGELTYRALFDRAAAVADRLTDAGAGPEGVVPVLSGREVDLVPALLGVLASGAAFSVVDADAPAGWSAGLIGALSAKAGLVVSGRTRPDVCPQWIDMAEVAGAGPNRIGAVDGVGYVAFTSGTTGRPRGVRGGIAPIAHFLSWYVDAFGIGPADRFALLSAPGHDPLLRDVFTPLWVGGTLCVPGAGLIRTPVALLDWLRRERITVLHLTPALGRLLNLAADGVRTEVRLVCLGGDVLHAGDVAGIARWAPNAVVVNGYGATETPQLVACAVCTGTGEPTIGRAAPGAQLLVTNAGDDLAGIGELGRIVVRGPYLAEGYLDGTTGGFAADPVAGHRRFDTGDLGRYRPDGAIELLGRLDDQVQVRGFRVEPAELDRRLRTLPTVRDSASVALRGPDGENRLVSYLVADQPAPDVATVRAHLRDLLPAALLPAEVYLVEEIRLTRNGKPDRAALAGMTATAPQRRPTAVGVNRLEERIIEVWREVLDVGAIDPDRNFFDLGASSVLMIRAQLALQQRLGRELPITALFEHASVRALAAHLADADRAAGPVSRPAQGGQRSSMRARRLAARAGTRNAQTDDAEGQP